MSDFKLTEQGEQHIKDRLEEIKKEMIEVENETAEMRMAADDLDDERQKLLCEEAVLTEALRKFK